MRAKLSATTAATPAYLIATGACSSAKVTARDKQVSLLDLLVKLRVETVHRILCHLHRIVGSSLEPERNDNVSIHIIRPDPRPPLESRWNCHRYFLGSAILPSIAE